MMSTFVRSSITVLFIFLCACGSSFMPNMKTGVSKDQAQPFLQAAKAELDDLQASRDPVVSGWQASWTSDQQLHLFGFRGDIYFKVEGSEVIVTFARHPQATGSEDSDRRAMKELVDKLIAGAKGRTGTSHWQAPTRLRLAAG